MGKSFLGPFSIGQAWKSGKIFLEEIQFAKLFKQSAAVIGIATALTRGMHQNKCL